MKSKKNNRLFMKCLSFIVFSFIALFLFINSYVQIPNFVLHKVFSVLDSDAKLFVFKGKVSWSSGKSEIGNAPPILSSQLTAKQASEIRNIFSRPYGFKWPIKLFCNTPNYKISSGNNRLMSFFISVDCNKLILNNGETFELPHGFAKDIEQVLDKSTWQTISPDDNLK